MFTCSGKYGGKRGTITVGDGLLLFSTKNILNNPTSFSLGGIPIPVSDVKSSKEMTFNFGGRTYAVSDEEDRPSEIAIPVESIFEIGVEGVDLNGSDYAVSVFLGSVFIPAGLAYLGSKTNANKLVLLVDTSVIPGNPRHEFETREMQALGDALKSEIFLMKKKYDLQDNDDKIVIKETVREIVKITCRYCGTLNEVSRMNCDKCGAPIK